MSLHHDLGDLYSVADSIHAGLAEPNPLDLNSKDFKYILDPDFIEAFDLTVLFLLCAGIHAQQMPKDITGAPLQGNVSLPLVLFRSKRTRAKHLLMEAQARFITDYSAKFAYGPIAGEELLAIIVSQLETDLKIHGHRHLIKMYKEYVTMLVRLPFSSALRCK